MKKTRISKLLSFMLCLVLVAAIALFASACGDKTETPSDPPSSTPSSSDPSSSTPSSSEDTANGSEIGQGTTKFTLSITFSDGSEKTYTVSTDRNIVGDALVDAGLISGTEGPYGLMVETVDGETVTYEKDKKYWAFYIDGKYAVTGVDSTEITAGAEYALKVEK